MKSVKKALFIVPTLTSVYHQNRVEQIGKIGIDCEVAAFEREYYPGKPWNQDITLLGFIEHKKYLKRIHLLIKAIPVIRLKSKNSDLVFCYNLDLLLICWISLIALNSKPKIIHDVSDIRSVLTGNGIIASFLRWLERFLLRRVSIVIVTSPAYVKEYFHLIQNLYDVCFHLIENKLNPDSTPEPISNAEPRPDVDPPIFNIGYFGLIRCRKSLELLLKLATKAGGKFRVVLRGVLLETEDFEPIIANHPFVEYKGPFVNPDDLPIMHQNVDFSWLVHAHSRENTKWSRIFRFYHAAYYQCPMIAQKDSQDGKVVEDLNIGLTIDISDSDESISELLKITNTQIKEWRNKVQSLPQSLSVISSEYDELIRKVEESCNC